MKKQYSIHLLLLLHIFCAVQSEPRITIFFKPQPLTDAEKISQKLRKPGKIAKYTAKGVMQASHIEGLVVTYGGYVAASDYNGEVSFPRKHPKAAATILITPEIIPVPLFESTILNWKRVLGLPATMYICEQWYDEKKNEYYWETHEAPLLEDMGIPLAAIIIVANPENVTMDVGRVPTHGTANLVLPDVYVKKGINTIKNSLYMLTIRHLFKPIKTEENREPLKILTHIVD